MISLESKCALLIPSSRQTLLERVPGSWAERSPDFVSRGGRGRSSFVISRESPGRPRIATVLVL
jgi:hypothetical protein